MSALEAAMEVLGLPQGVELLELLSGGRGKTMQCCCGPCKAHPALGA